MGHDAPIEVTEEAIRAKWHDEMAPAIETLVKRVGDPKSFKVPPRSPLAGDDRAAHPVQVSPVFRAHLNTAVDHLNAAKTLVVDNNMLHVAAPNTLARGVIENAAMAWWVLAPRRRNDRVQRALRVYFQDAKDEKNALSLTTAPTTHAENAHALLSKLAEQRGVLQGLNDRIKLVDVVRDMSRATGYDIELMWRASSAFAHGRTWASMHLLDREVIEQADGHTTYRLTNRSDYVWYANWTGLMAIQEAMRVWRQRTTPPYG